MFSFCPADGWGYQKDDLEAKAANITSMSGDQQTVEGMDRIQHPPAVAAAINALYEAEHPAFESRMDGASHFVTDE